MFPIQTKFHLNQRNIKQEAQMGLNRSPENLLANVSWRCLIRQNTWAPLLKIVHRGKYADFANFYKQFLYYEHERCSEINGDFYLSPRFKNGCQFFTNF